MSDTDSDDNDLFAPTAIKGVDMQTTEEEALAPPPTAESIESDAEPATPKARPKKLQAQESDALPPSQDKPGARRRRAPRFLHLCCKSLAFPTFYLLSQLAFSSDILFSRPVLFLSKQGRSAHRKPRTRRRRKRRKRAAAASRATSLSPAARAKPAARARRRRKARARAARRRHLRRPSPRSWRRCGRRARRRKACSSSRPTPSTQTWLTSCGCISRWEER